MSRRRHSLPAWSRVFYSKTLSSMTRLASLSFIALTTALACGSAAAQTAFPSTLAGHAVLPAQSFVATPKDAPADLQVSATRAGQLVLLFALSYAVGSPLMAALFARFGR
eukprot:gene4307-5686_t